MSRAISGVLFDLDQTLTDRSASISEYARRFHRDFDGRLNGVGPSAITETIRVLDSMGYAPRPQVFDGLAQMPGWVSAPAIEEVGKHWLTFFPVSAVGREGLHETLGTLADRGYQLGIITNGSTRSQRAKIETLGIGKYLTTLVISEDAGFAKPDARIFHRGVRDIGVPSGACLFVGDHPLNDVVGASDAGLVSAWLEGVHEWPSDVPSPSLRIRRLPELLELPELGASRPT